MKQGRIAGDSGHFTRPIGFAGLGICSAIQHRGHQLLAALSRVTEGFDLQSRKAAENCAEATEEKVQVSQGYVSRAVSRLGLASSEDLQVVIRCIDLLNHTEALDASIKKQLSFETA